MRWIGVPNSERSRRPLLKGVNLARLDAGALEDRDAEVDANVVMLEPAQFVEVQGTGEHGTFSRAELGTLLDLAERACGELFAAQRRALGW